MNNRLINTKVAGGGGTVCTDIVDNYDPFGGNGVALYQLNGNANDVSTNYNGAWSGTEAYTTGVFGQAGVFNGSSSWIDIRPLQDALNGGYYTFSVWINPTDLSGIETIIYTQTAKSNFRLLLVDNVLYQEQYTAAVEQKLITYTGILANTWTHIAGLWNGSNIELYVNGSNVGSTPCTSIRSYESNHFRIGKYVDSPAYYFNGSIDQVRIFNTALDPLEVEALYTEELCICDGTVDTLQVLGDTSCIATYQLDGNANDLSGNYSGTPTDVSYGVGEFDLAGVFNGSSSKIDIPAITPSNLKSVSFWINSSDTGASKQIFSMGLVGVYNWLSIRLNSGKLEAGYGSNNGAYLPGSSVKTSLSYNDGSWYHVVCTFTGTYGTSQVPNIYVNGSDVSTVAGAESGSPLSPSGAGAFGYYNPQNILYFNGKLDQVRIFDKALDQNDVDTLFAETACTKAACTGTTNTLNILGGGDTSCIAAYPLDGSPADLSGNYNGVQTDVTYPQGYFDLAGSFNGSSSYVEILDSNYDVRGNFSLSLWFKLNNLSSNQTLFAKILNTSEKPLTIRVLTDGRLLVEQEGNNSNYNAFSTNTVSAGNWYNLVWTADADFYGKLYINNVLFLTTNPGTVNINNGVPSLIGIMGAPGSVYNGSNQFNGLIDQVRVFNKALSLEEVGILFNDETPCS